MFYVHGDVLFFNKYVILFVFFQKSQCQYIQTLFAQTITGLQYDGVIRFVKFGESRRLEPVLQTSVGKFASVSQW